MEHSHHTLSTIITNSNTLEIKHLFLTTIFQMSHIFNFTKTYASSILLLYQKFLPLYTSTLSSIFTNEIKPLFTFIQSTSSSFSSFSSELQSINASFTSSTNPPFHSLHSLLTASHSHLVSILSQISSQTVPSHSLLSKLDSFSETISTHTSTLSSLTERINHKITKLIAYYDNEYSFVIRSFKVNFNNVDYVQTYKTFPDFILMYMKLISSINKLHSKLALFLNETNIIFEDITISFCEFYSILKQYISSYIENMKHIVSEDIQKQYDNIDIFYAMCSKEKIEERMSISNILNSDKTMINSFDKIFTQIQECLVKDEYGDICKDIVEDDKQYRIASYVSLSAFVKFLIRTIPRAYEIEYDKLVKKKFDVKLTGGLFKGSKPVTLMFTFQEHLIVIIHNEIENSENEGSDDNDIKCNTYMVMDIKYVEVKQVKGKKYLLQLSYKNKEKDNKVKDNVNKQHQNEINFHIFKGKVSYTVECLSQDKLNKILAMFTSPIENSN